MTEPDRMRGQADPERPQRRGRSDWWLALLALPIVCCAGPALLTAVGIGSLGTIFAAGTGRAALAVGFSLAVVLVVAVIAVRQRNSAHRR